MVEIIRFKKRDRDCNLLIRGKFYSVFIKFLKYVEPVAIPIMKIGMRMGEATAMITAASAVTGTVATSFKGISAQDATLCLWLNFSPFSCLRVFDDFKIGLTIRSTKRARGTTTPNKANAVSPAGIAVTRRPPNGSLLLL